MKKISTSKVLSFSEMFVRRAQSFTYNADAMKTELDRAIGKQVQQILIEFLNTKPISSVTLNIVFDAAGKKATFKPITNNGNKEVEQELMTALAKFAPIAGKIIAKHQKESMDYKYLEMEA